jgi:hypothetical protein
MGTAGSGTRAFAEGATGMGASALASADVATPH